MKPTYCINCKHRYPDSYGDQCNHPSLYTRLGRDYVTGGYYVSYKYPKCKTINTEGKCQMYERKWWKFWV